MAKKTFIIVTHEFYGIHSWADCPKDRPNSFLINPHRHKFLIKVKAEVTHNNRDIEFFILQRDVIKSLYTLYPPMKGLVQTLELGSSSCERVAELVFGELWFVYDYKTIRSIEVWEDNENGAEVLFYEEDKEEVNTKPKRSFVDRLLWWGSTP